MVEFFSDPNILYTGLIVTNGIWLFLVVGVRKMIGGKHFDSAIKAVTKRIKHPARFHKLYKSQYLETEIQDTTEAPKFYPNYSVPLSLDEGKRYNGESPLKEYLLVEGGLENIDPMSKEQPFINALMRLGETNNKARDIEEARLRNKYDDDMVTKKHFNMGIIVIVIGLVIVGALIYNATDLLSAFQSTFDAYKPVIDNAIQNIPRIE